MKKYLLVVVIAMVLGMAMTAFAQDIAVTEVRPDVSVWKLDTVKFLVFTQTAEITYRKGYMEDGEFKSSGQRKKILFMNTADDPETTEVDETCNEFTQLVNLINSESNIQQSITKAVKIKLGL